MLKVHKDPIYSPAKIANLTLFSNVFSFSSFSSFIDASRSTAAVSEAVTYTANYYIELVVLVARTGRPPVTIECKSRSHSPLVHRSPSSLSRWSRCHHRTQGHRRSRAFRSGVRTPPPSPRRHGSIFLILECCIGLSSSSLSLSGQPQSLVRTFLLLSHRPLVFEFAVYLCGHCWIRIHRCACCTS